MLEDLEKLMSSALALLGWLDINFANLLCKESQKRAWNWLINSQNLNSILKKRISSKNMEVLSNVCMTHMKCGIYPKEEEKKKKQEQQKVVLIAKKW